MTTSRKPSLEAKQDDVAVEETTTKLEETSLESDKPVVAPTEEAVGEVVIHDADEKEKEKEEAVTAAAPDATDATPEPTATDATPEATAATPEAEKQEETAPAPAATVTSHSLFSSRVPSPTPAPVADYETPRP